MENNMEIIKSYDINEKAYRARLRKSNLVIETTEHRRGDSTLIMQRLGRDTVLRLAELFGGAGDRRAQNLGELYMRQRAGEQPEKITRSEYLRERKAFGEDSFLRRETVERYSYINKDRHKDAIDITITEQAGSMTAVIEFEDIGKLVSFNPPPWFEYLEDIAN